MSDRIEKQIMIEAPLARVWRALTDHKEFGAWFRVKLDGPFVVGQPSRGHVTYPGYEHVAWNAQVLAMEPERRFAFSWHPYAVEPGVDYEAEPPTVVEFTLEAVAGGTLLHVTETGFDRIPAARRLEAFRMNEGGWAEQMQNIRQHVGAAPG